MVSVYSWDYEDLPEAKVWFLMARAYLGSSLHLFESMKTEAIPSDYFQAKSAGFLFEHSIELFLKGAVLQARAPIQAHHELDEHFRQFSKLYPGKKFEFSAKIRDVATPDLNRPDSIFNRYPRDRSGRIWEKNSHFNIDIWIEQLQLFRADFERLEPLIRECYPPTA